MDPEKSTDNDQRLSDLLRDWQVTTKLPPRFQEQVWQRIERLDRRSEVLPQVRKLMAYWIGALLPRPAAAPCYVTILLVIGAGAGWFQARQGVTRVGDELGARYVHSVDPYQKAQ
jgi:hypothetical protein